MVIIMDMADMANMVNMLNRVMALIITGHTWPNHIILIAVMVLTTIMMEHTEIKMIIRLNSNEDSSRF